MSPFNDVKNYDGIKESIKRERDSLIQIPNSLGPLGTASQIDLFYSFYHLITHNQISVTKYFYLQLDNLKHTFQVFKYYLMDENGRISNSDPCIRLNPFNLNWHFLHHN